MRKKGDLLMNRLRGLLAIVLFIPGFILIAGGLCWVVFSIAGSALAKPQPPFSTVLLNALPGAVAAVVGVGLLLGSRAADGKRGPVRRYGRARNWAEW